jgi:hypothetical protein
MNLSMWVSGILAVSSALLIGCDRGSEPASRTHVTSAEQPAPVNPASIDAIALARCDREQRCGNLGDGKKFSNREACLNDIRSQGDDTLTTSACPGGIDTMRLERCLDAIRGERCDNPLDLMSRLNACRTDELCPAGVRRTE